MKNSKIFLFFILWMSASTCQTLATDYGPSRIDENYVSNDNIVVNDDEKLDLNVYSNNAPIYIKLPDGEPLFFAPQNEDTAIDYGDLSGFLSSLNDYVFQNAACDVYILKNKEFSMRCQTPHQHINYSLKKDSIGFQIYSIDDGIKIRKKTADIINYMYDNIMQIEFQKAQDQ